MRAALPGASTFGRGQALRALREPFTVRPIAVADVPAAVALVTRVLGEFDLAFGDGSETDLAMYALPGSYRDAGGEFWVAVAADGTIVGTCGVGPCVGTGLGTSCEADPSTLELRKMYLAPETRGHGLGARLLDAAKGFAVAHGVRQLVLDTTEQMGAAIAFYERHGFVRDDSQIRGSRCSRGYILTL